MLRPATDADLDAMRAWRNHPQVRAVSLTQHEIAAEEHAAWWAKTKDDPTRRVLVYELSGVPSGVVSFFDVEGGEAMWGFYLDLDGLEARGQTLIAWTKVGREAVAYAFDELGVQVLRGEVLGANESVRKMNSLWGFTETGPRPSPAGDAYDLELRVENRKGRRS